MDTQVYVLTKHTESMTDVIGVFSNRLAAIVAAWEEMANVRSGYVGCDDVKDVLISHWEEKEKPDDHYRVDLYVGFKDGDEYDYDWDITPCVVK